jgi:hypothetical protein
LSLYTTRRNIRVVEVYLNSFLNSALGECSAKRPGHVGLQGQTLILGVYGTGVEVLVRRPSLVTLSRSHAQNSGKDYNVFMSVSFSNTLQRKINILMAGTHIIV